MALERRYRRLVARLVPLGALGATFLLGSTLDANAASRPVPDPMANVAERLSAVRDATFHVIGPADLADQSDPNIVRTWLNRWANWGPGRWRRPRWNNWRNGWPNWNNFWRNW